jgi:histidine triad (HIT) family protein
MSGGEIPIDALYRDDRCFVLRDIHPQAPVHLLIIPLRHFEYPEDMTEASEALVGHLFTVAREMAQREAVAATGYRLATNQGGDAGQTIAHLHLHLLGGRQLGPEG